VGEILRGAGTMFDPDVVRDLLSLRGVLPGLLESAAQSPRRENAGQETPRFAMSQALALGA